MEAKQGSQRLYLHPPAGVTTPPQETASNSDKSVMLAGLMFPACPLNSTVLEDFQYEDSFRTHQKSWRSKSSVTLVI